MSRMTDHVTAQLTARGLALDSLAAFARPLDADECLLLVGSVAEGLANADSDVDLMLIGSRTPGRSFAIDRGACAIETIHVSEATEISIETFEPSYLRHLEPAMAQAEQALADPGSANGVSLITSIPHLEILHRIATGIPLGNGDVVEGWRERLHLDVFSEVLALGASTDHFANREDGISHVLEGDYQTATLCFRLAASDLAATLLATVGCTVASRRWQFRLLRRHEDEIGSRQVAALIASMMDRVEGRADVEALLAMFDELLLDAAGRLPRVTELALQMVDAFPVHSHLDGDGTVSDMLEDVPRARSADAHSEHPPS